jgi:hypothetical protein
LSERDHLDYPILDQLDRLEELLEAMDELGVASREEIERRIAELEAQLNDVPDETDDVEAVPWSGAL